MLLACVLLAGCNDTRDLAPASPVSSWEIAPNETVAKQLAARKKAGASAAPRQYGLPQDPALPWPSERSDIDPNRTYSLVELIDVAQRRSKATRISWEQARQAAIGVGIARAAYLPELSISALGGYKRTATPLPTRLAPQGYVTSDAEAVFPEAAIRYLLLDFGGRAATVEGAKQLSFAANVAFTAAHQKLILDVSRAYFMLDGVDAQLRAARRSLANAHVLQNAADAKYRRGEGTTTEVAQARRGTAQASFDVAQAASAQSDAMLALLQAMELPPTTKLRIMDSSARPLPHSAGRTVDRMMHDALSKRPDLLAKLAMLRASDADIALARSEFLPKVSVTANVLGNIGQVSSNGSSYQSIAQPEAGVYLRFDWPLYKGGEMRNRLRLAESKRAEAEDRLQQSSDQAMREVAKAYDRLETGLAEYQSATALQSASQTAFNAALDAYAHGVGTLTDATTAQTALTGARANVVRAHAQSLVNAAALAFATGELTSSAALGIAPTSR